jgi:hypothetical protein
MREEQKVARRDLHFLAPVRESRQARAVGQKMEKHDVVGARQAACGGGQPVLRLDAPRRLELRFDIDRAVQPDGRKNVGQGIHGVRLLTGLFYALRKRSASQLAIRRRMRLCALRSTRPMFMNPWIVPSQHS